MKRAAEQEAQKKAKEERKKAKEEAKRAAEEEVRRLAEEEAKKKAEEDAWKRAEFQARWQAKKERKAREKAEAKAAVEVMRAQIAQKAGQGKKPKPKPKVCGIELFSSYFFTNLFFRYLATSGGQSAHGQQGSPGVVPPCNWCQKSGDSKGCVLPDNARTLTCQQCQKMKVKCHFEVSAATMMRSASGEKRKESETSATVVATSP